MSPKIWKNRRDGLRTRFLMGDGALRGDGQVLVRLERLDALGDGARAARQARDPVAVFLLGQLEDVAGARLSSQRDGRTLRALEDGDDPDGAARAVPPALAQLEELGRDGDLAPLLGLRVLHWIVDAGAEILAPLF